MNVHMSANVNLELNVQLNIHLNVDFDVHRNECSHESSCNFCPALTKLALDLHVNFCMYLSTLLYPGVTI